MGLLHFGQICCNVMSLNLSLLCNSTDCHGPDKRLSTAKPFASLGTTNETYSQGSLLPFFFNRRHHTIRRGGKRTHNSFTVQDATEAGFAAG